MTQAASVALIDYDMGNVWSVLTALKYLGADAELVSDPALLSNYRHIILPGVGSFRVAMETLHQRGMAEAIKARADNGAQSLGTCLGMQLLGRDSSEDCDGNTVTAGLGLVDNRVRRFVVPENLRLKIPHVGFNTVSIDEEKGLFANLGSSADFYFTHSYRMLRDQFDGNCAMCSYGETFLAAFEQGNICGTQFHPEKSQTNGLVILKNFLEQSPC